MLSNSLRSPLNVMLNTHLGDEGSGLRHGRGAARAGDHPCEHARAASAHRRGARPVLHHGRMLHGGQGAGAVAERARALRSGCDPARGERAARARWSRSSIRAAGVFEGDAAAHAAGRFTTCWRTRWRARRRAAMCWSSVTGAASLRRSSCATTAPAFRRIRCRTCSMPAGRCSTRGLMARARRACGSGWR